MSREWGADLGRDPNEGTYPQPLTLDEIVEVLLVVDTLNIEGNGKDNIEEVRRNIKYNLYLQLTSPGAKYAKLPNLIPEMKQHIAMMYSRCKAEEGLPCGHIASQSNSSTSIQGTLNSFKALSGISGTIQSSVAALTSLLYTYDRKTNIVSIVHFNMRNPMSKRDIIDLRPELLELKLAKLIEDWQPGYLSPILTRDRPSDFLQRYQWHSVHEIRNNAAIRADVRALRLYLNCSTMFYHQVTPEDVSKAIMHSVESNRVIIAFSPYNTGIVINGNKVCIVDVIAVPENIPNGRTIDGQTTFLQKEIYNRRDDIYVKGIRDLTELYPMSYEYRVMIKMDGIKTYDIAEHENAFAKKFEYEMEKVNREIDDSYTFVEIEPEDEDVFPFEMEDLGNIIVGTRDRLDSRSYVVATQDVSNLQYDYRHFTDDPEVRYRRVTKDARIVDRYPGALTWDLPLQLSHPTISSSLFPAYRELKLWLNQIGLTVVGTLRHPITDAIVSYVVVASENPAEKIRDSKGEYSYAIARGGDYGQLIRLSYVDPLRTTTNNIHKISHSIGCEASRRYFLYELNQILGGEKNDVNSRHQTVIADLIYVKGVAHGTTFQGNVARGQGPISLATEEKGGYVLKSAANNRAFESTASVTTAIVTGQRPYVGETAKRILMSKEEKEASIDEFQKLKEKKRNLRSNPIITAEAVRERNGMLYKLIKHSTRYELPQLAQRAEEAEIVMKPSTAVPSQSPQMTPPYVVPSIMSKAATKLNVKCDIRPSTKSSVVVSQDSMKHGVSQVYEKKPFLPTAEYDVLLQPIKPRMNNPGIKIIIEQYAHKVSQIQRSGEEIAELTSIVPSLGKRPQIVQTEIINGSVILDIPYPMFDREPLPEVDLDNILANLEFAMSLFS